MNFVKDKKLGMLITIILEVEGIIPSFLIIKIIISLGIKRLRKFSALPRAIIPLGW